MPLLFSVESLFPSKSGDLPGALLALPSFVISTSPALAFFHLHLPLPFWIAVAAVAISLDSFSLWPARTKEI